MTTKDYEVVADAIRETVGDAHVEPAVEELVSNLSEAFKRDNPRFHKATFYRRALDCLPSEVKPESAAFRDRFVQRPDDTIEER